MSKSNDQSPISMGKLQIALETAERSAKAAERALKRAQESRDSAVALAAKARAEFVNASRAVLG